MSGSVRNVVGETMFRNKLEIDEVRCSRCCFIDLYSSAQYSYDMLIYPVSCWRLDPNWLLTMGLFVSPLVRPGLSFRHSPKRWQRICP